MIAPTLMLFNSHMEAAIFFIGFLVFIAVLSINGYRQTRGKEERKDILAFFAIFGSMTVLSLAIAAFFAFWYTPEWFI